MQHRDSLSNTSLLGWLPALTVAGIALLAATMVPARTSTAQAIPEVAIQASTDGISVEFLATTRRNLLTISVRVVGPDRFVFQGKAEEPVLPWIPPADLADGFYHWEAWVVSANVGAPMREWTPVLEARAAYHWFDEEFKQTHITTGSFRVEGGLLQAHSPQREEDEGPSRPVRIAGAVLDFLVPSARAATEGSSNNFFGTGAGDNNEGVGNSFFGGSAGHDNTTGCCNSFFGVAAGFSNTTGSENAFFGTDAGVFNSTGFSNAFFGTGAGFNNTTGFRNSFFGRDAGESNTEGINNAFFGHSAGSSNTTEFNNTFIGTFSDGAAGITNATALGFRAKVTQSNSLVLGSIAGVNGTFSNTDVGIGVTAPAAPLHVRRFNSTAQVLVEDTGASSVQTLFSLINNGHPKFRLQDTAQSDVRWEFRTAGTQGSTERFQINKIGSGAINAEFQADGDLVIPGSYLTSSSRTVKDRITSLDGATVLAKLAALPIHEWSYRASPASRHAGPMAEDFHAAFGFGPDDRHVSPTDLAGVALAAAKALKAENDALKAKVAEIESLKARLAGLERLIRQ